MFIFGRTLLISPHPHKQNAATQHASSSHPMQHTPHSLLIPTQTEKPSKPKNKPLPTPSCGMRKHRATPSHKETKNKSQNKRGCYNCSYNPRPPNQLQQLTNTFPLMPLHKYAHTKTPAQPTYPMNHIGTKTS
jgi:hypothetical protein